MSIIKKIRLPFTTEEQTPIALKSFKGSTKNRVTVLIGENGVRKSYMLRAILDSILEIMMEKKYLTSGMTNSVELVRTPKKVFALSATPTDRFPSKPNANERLMTKYNVEQYSYIGPRTARNILSRNQSLDELIRNILRRPESIKDRGPFISDILEKIGLYKQFIIGLEPLPFSTKKIDAFLEERLKYHPAGNSVDIFNQALDFLASKKGDLYREQIESVALKKNNYRGVRVTADGEVPTFPFNIYIDAENGSIKTSDDISTEALAWGLQIGYIRARQITFRIGDKTINQDQLSSGQWNLFSTMVSLTSSIESDSVVLVDEPENGLHPAWQRTFLSMFHQAISHAKGCHIVVATHSPLILSSLSPSHSDLITLLKTEDKNNIEARQEITPAGWDASVILQEKFELEDARSPDLTELVDEALRIISSGSADKSEKLQPLLKKIMPYYTSLPEEDLGKSIISSIISIATLARK